MQKNFHEVAFSYNDIQIEIIHQRKLSETLNSVCEKLENFLMENVRIALIFKV